MDHVLSTHVLANHRLTTVWLERIQNAGIPAVEIFCTKQHINYRDQGQISDLAAWFHDSPLKVHSLHSPIYSDDVWGRSGPSSHINIAETVKGKRIAHVDEIKRALEIAETIPCKYLIQHLGAGEEEYDERAVDAAFTSLEELSIFAHQRGVQILIENIPNALSSAERLMLFIKQTHLRAGFCLDVGHANLNEGVPEAFETMKDRIRSTHIHDNDGKTDQHLFPFLAQGGTIDWNNTMKLLRSRPDQYPLLLELKESPQHPNPLAAVTQIFEKLESLDGAS
ncbi:MAG: sugar phosphate isomerase/epimerase [Acidobacteriaceae bacterium]|nr:sugar phosphate isomerase/epimerase [Acidobacteriaceae bacterium]